MSSEWLERGLIRLKSGEGDIEVTVGQWQSSIIKCDCMCVCGNKSGRWHWVSNCFQCLADCVTQRERKRGGGGGEETHAHTHKITTLFNGDKTKAC